jgi:hypothetical protein
VSLPVDPAILAAAEPSRPELPADFLVASDPGLKLPYTHEWKRRH